MPGAILSTPNEIDCDRCAGKAGFQLMAGPHGDHPGGAVYTCDRCGNVIWIKRTIGQQQQQPQKKD
jgi:DNA-directed RNA polymerase subunit M/transcription elongation factor TFIIS